jgi:hypothetical protein
VVFADVTERIYQSWKGCVNEASQQPKPRHSVMTDFLALDFSADADEIISISTSAGSFR